MQLRRDRHALLEIERLAGRKDVRLEGPGHEAGRGLEFGGFGGARAFAGGQRGGGGRSEGEGERRGGEGGVAVRVGERGRAVEVQEEGEEGGEEGVEDVERVRGNEGVGVDAQRVGGERERQQRRGTGSGGGEEAYGVHGGVDGEGEGGGLAVCKGRVDEVVARGVAVPEEVRGLGLPGAAERFGLQVVAVVAVEVVRDRDGGGLVERHEFGESGEDAGEEGGAARWNGESGAGYGDGGGGVEGMGARDGEGGGSSAEAVDWREGGGEGDIFERRS